MPSHISLIQMHYITYIIACLVRNATSQVIKSKTYSNYNGIHTIIVQRNG